MGRTWRRNSDDWPKQQRRNKRRKTNKTVRDMSKERYNSSEDYIEHSYSEEYDAFERFEHGKRKGK